MYKVEYNFTPKIHATTIHTKANQIIKSIKYSKSVNVQPLESMCSLYLLYHLLYMYNEQQYLTYMFGFTLGFQWGSVSLSLVLCVCFVVRCFSFCTCSLGHCVVFDMQILITPLESSHSSYCRFVHYLMKQISLTFRSSEVL